MDEAEVEEVIHLVDRQKKRLHFAGSFMHVQPACKELRQMPLFQGLNDQDFAKVQEHSLVVSLLLYLVVSISLFRDKHSPLTYMTMPCSCQHTVCMKTVVLAMHRWLCCKASCSMQ